MRPPRLQWQPFVRGGKPWRLAIEADSGGGNGNRCWLWKLALQQLADEFNITITVGRLPAAASKWNLIEHRMFNLISANWAGEPLVSYETVLKFIRTTRSATGFCCRAKLDRTAYKTKVKISEGQKASVNLKRHEVLSKWNYTIRPQGQNDETVNGRLSRNG
jgi:hypothetical protein